MYGERERGSGDSCRPAPLSLDERISIHQGLDQLELGSRRAPLLLRLCAGETLLYLEENTGKTENPREGWTRKIGR